MATIMEALGGNSGETIMEALGGSKGQTIAEVIEEQGIDPSVKYVETEDAEFVEGKTYYEKETEASEE